MKGNIANLKKEISELKKQLNELNVEKEKWFSIKENLKKEVSELIRKIRIFQSTRDRTDKQVKELKEKRDSNNKQVKDLIKTFKELNSKKHKLLKEKKIDFDPAAIIKKIEELEFKLETDAVSFKREQQVMKQINLFKKQLGEVGEAQEIFKQLKSLSEKITEIKAKADEYHKQIKNAGRTNYQDLINMSKQIGELKKRQEEAFKKFIDSKDKFSKINEELKLKLKQTRDLNISKEIKKLERQEREINEKVRKVNEKLKKDKKLTTEDLIVFQNLKED